MQYLGGKSRLAKSIASFLLERLGGRTFVEPFCGALNITAAMEPAGYRVASDLNPYLFTLYKALRGGWQPPEVVTEETYREVSARRDVGDPMTAFIGYGCSFGGKWWAGYARKTEKRKTRPSYNAPTNFASLARVSLAKKFARCRDVAFAQCAYDRLAVDMRCFVYCDPPYAATEKYDAVEDFDTDHFWAVVREWSRAGVIVYVSEFCAPADFRSVWSITRTKQLSGGVNGIQTTVDKTEHLFTWAGA